MQYTKVQPSSEIKISDIDFQQLFSSELLQSGLKETLRIQAHNLSPRNLVEDTVVKIEGKEYLLKKGSFAFAPSTLVNWNGDIYNAPTKWKPERFMDKQNEFQEQQPKYDMKKLKMPLLIWGGGHHTV
jgi:cytochrome P450